MDASDRAFPFLRTNARAAKPRDRGITETRGPYYTSLEFGAGGAAPVAELEREGTRDPDWLIHQARRFFQAGAHMLMIESEGITEGIHTVSRRRAA